jgi:hypothetical protein
MNGTELLQRRAERGTPRGPDAVWATAQLSGASDSTGTKSPRRGPDRSVLLLRVALLAWIVGLGAVVYTNVTGGTSLDTPRSESEPAPTESTEPLPEPVLVDGMTLERVSRPFDPDFDGDDTLGVNGVRVDASSLGEEQRERSVVFADPDDPFDNPIVGLTLLDGGGFRPWSANTGDTPLTDFTSQLVQVDGEWTMPDESGLVEVARFDDNPYDNLRFGWQFDFANGDDNVILQAETRPDGDEPSVWVWVARLSQGPDQPLIIAEIDVLDHRGIRIDRGQADEPTDEVVWVADDFVYRLTADNVQGNTAVQRSASPEASRLQLVDRADWVEAVNRTDRFTTTQAVVVRVGALVMLTLLGSVIVFAFRRSWRPAGVALLTVGAVVMVGSGTISNLLVLVLGLAAAWWLHRSRHRHAAPASSASRAAE